MDQWAPVVVVKIQIKRILFDLDVGGDTGKIFCLSLGTSKQSGNISTPAVI